MYDKKRIIAELAVDGGGAIEAVDFAVSELAPNLAIVTYRTIGSSGEARRSSLWRAGSDGWRMVFHQGTPIEVANPEPPVPVPNCFACDLSSGRIKVHGGVIHRQDGWIVEHCVGPLGIGTLVVKPERHVVHVADLSAAEATAMGRLLHRATQVVTKLCDPEQVYASLWSHAGGEPGHIHYVVQPVSVADTERHGVHGPKLQAAMFDADNALDPVLVEASAARARELWGSAATATA